MANLPELSEFTAGVYQIETSDPVLGGVDGVTNVPLKALVNRTRWLKEQVDTLAAEVASAIDAAYVQGELHKLPFKAPAVAVSTANITLSGLQTIDGVSLLAGQRVLVMGQSTQAQNGIYTAQSSAWVRAADMDADAEIQPGVLLVVTGGTIYADTIWQLATDGTITVGATAQSWRCLTNNTALLGTPTAPTPPQFDNDTSLATTAFVQRALGNEAGVVVVAANRAMTAADAGKYLFSNANNITYTLPDPAGLPLGAKFRIAQGNLTSGGAIAAPGGVTIGNITDGGTVSSVAMAQSTEYVLTVVTSSAYQLTRIASTGVFTQSLTASGWQKLPSGLIFQWGVRNSMGDGGTVSVTYPVAFTVGAFAGFATVHAIVGTANSSEVAFNPIDATSFNLGYNATVDVSRNVYWFAIGI